MTDDRWTAIHDFWSSFGIPAYDESTVPVDAEFPRITYSVSVDSIDRPVSTYANVWYRSTSWLDASQKADEIEKAILEMNPPTIDIDTGRVYITRGTPFAQRLTDPDDMVRRIYINVNVEYFTN